MKQLLGAVKELWGLFVDDQSYAAAIVTWIVVGAVVSRYVPESRWTAPALAAGLIVILIENIVRAASKAHKRENTAERSISAPATGNR